MKNLSFRIVDPKTRAFAVMSSKTGVRKRSLAAIKTLVTDRFDEFQLFRGRLNEVEAISLTEDSKKALEHCYSSPTEALKAIKEEMKRSLKEQYGQIALRCSYCQVRDPSCWDHYLPLSRFPEFSVFPPNLLYVCSVCNTKKGDLVQEDKKRFLHAYFDNLGDSSLVIAVISFHSNVVEISFDTHPDIQGLSPLHAAVCEHFEFFDLKNLYLRKAKEYLSSILQPMQKYKSGNLSYREYLRIIEVEKSRIPVNSGKNDWKLITIDAMETHASEVIRFVNSCPMAPAPSLAPIDGWEY
ncbi:hypothetical protein [Bdellovibrio bacteriovorus]|uniref:hypothetical protein n=1 Tax=Bdellovibrio bacteriovorus TaxID=959 RepID=UPI0035A678A8